VTLDVAGPDGPYRLTAAYVAGCDGARSPVRKQAGIGFPGTGPTQVSRFGDVTLADPEAAPRGMHRTPAGLCTTIPLGPGVHRVVVSEWRTDGDRDADEPLAGPLVRPDGYVAWAHRDGDDGLRDALGAWFGSTPPRGRGPRPIAHRRSE
jgi:2-polyprenyl-6-methoxyphenol hydroxylase-like FAD-dependent oxidoreductase